VALVGLALLAPAGLARPWSQKAATSPASLIESLASPDARARAGAARLLADYGWAKGAVPQLAALLDDEEPAVRAQAAVAIASARPGQAASSLVPKLAAMLSDPAAEVRAGAARALAAIGDRSDRVVRALLRCLAVPPSRPAAAPDVAFALVTLGQNDAGLGALRSLLGQGTSETRQAALGVIEDLGPAAGPLGLDVALLLDDGSVGLAAAHALGCLSSGERIGGDRLQMAVAARADRASRVAHAPLAEGGRAAAAVSVLVPLLDDPAPEAGRHAAEALRWIGPDAAGAVASLVGLLRRESASPAGGSARLAAVEALGAIGAPAAPAVPALAFHLRCDPEVAVRQRAAEALGAIGPAAAPAVPTLVARFRHDPDYVVSGAAIAALRRIGPAALPRLRELCLDPEPATRRSALWAIGALPAVDSVPLLQRALVSDPDGDARWAAARALAELGPRAAPAAAALLKAAAGRVPRPVGGEWRAEAIRALRGCSPEPAGAAEALLEAVHSDDPRVRAAAALGLATVGGPREAVPALVECLHTDADYSTREAATASLVGRCHERQAAEALARLLSDGDLAARHIAVERLALLGRVPRLLLPTVRALLDAPQPLVRLSAAEAVAKATADPAGLDVARAPLTHEAPRVRLEAAKALVRLGDGSGAAISCLAEMTRVGDREALAALGTAGPRARSAVHAVMAFLHRDALEPDKELAVDVLAAINPLQAD